MEYFAFTNLFLCILLQLKPEDSKISWLNTSFMNSSEFQLSLLEMELIDTLTDIGGCMSNPHLFLVHVNKRTFEKQ
jgi:hypothetical protein